MSPILIRSRDWVPPWPWPYDVNCLPSHYKPAAGTARTAPASTPKPPPPHKEKGPSA